MVRIKGLLKQGINQARQIAVKKAKKKNPKLVKAIQKNKQLKKISRKGMKKALQYV